MFQQPATLELTHNWGTESDPEAKMHNGNDKPQGYGHIGCACHLCDQNDVILCCVAPDLNDCHFACRFHVPDVDAACERFEKLGVEFVKKPNAGTMKGLAFIKVCM